MTAASNIFASVVDPDKLLAGTSRYAPFAVSHVQLYRYSSESNARSNVSGTLVTSFALIAESSEVSAEAGPYRWGYYDSAQDEDSWYAVRYRDSASANFSDFSEPYQSGSEGWTLRDLLDDIGKFIAFDSYQRGTNTGTSASTITCTALFKSTYRDSLWYQGAYALIEYDAGGASAAPELEERIIATVNTTTGVATLDNDLSAALASGDRFQVHALAPPSKMIECINRVRERMFCAQNQYIALNATGSQGKRYPVPAGVKGKADVLDVMAVIPDRETAWEDEYVEGFDIEFDGRRGWLILPAPPQTNLVRMRYVKSWRDIEGKLTAMTDVTRAPIEWLRAAAAWEIFSWADESEAAVARFARLTSMSEDEVRALSRRFAPYVPPRPLRPANREPIGPTWQVLTGGRSRQVG